MRWENKSVQSFSGHGAGFSLDCRAYLREHARARIRNEAVERRVDVDAGRTTRKPPAGVHHPCYEQPGLHVRPWRTESGSKAPHSRVTPSQTIPTSSAREKGTLYSVEVGPSFRG